MESGSNGLSAKEAEQKVQLMVDCMKYHLDDVDCLKKSLLSIASMCSSHNNIKEFLRESGCLQFILNLFTASKLQETSLFCLACAVDQDVYSQRYMISQYIFDHIHLVLQDKKTDDKLRQAAAFFISCISANNGSGQMNCKQSSCLIDLINLFRELIPKEMLSRNENAILLGNATLKNAELFTTVCNAICACANNPRNEENQDFCAKYILHPSLLLIQRCPHMPTVHSILNLMAVLVAGNIKNQEKVRELNGIQTLFDLLKTFTTATVENIEFLKMAVTLTSTLDACLLDNVKNAEQFGSCGGIKFLVNLLHFCAHKPSDMLQVILTVAHATDSSAMNQSRFTEWGGLAVLVPLLSEPIEEELLAAVKYVLQICVPDGSCQPQTITDNYGTNYDTDNESPVQEETCEEKEPGWLSDKLQAIVDRLDNIENGGYKAPSVVGCIRSDVKALVTKKNAENKETHQIKPAHHCHKQSEQNEQVEEEDDELLEHSVEDSQLLLTPVQQSHSETLTSAEKQLFKKPHAVNSERNSKSGVERRLQLTPSDTASVYSEFDFNLTANAKGYKDKTPGSENSAVSRSSVSRSSVSRSSVSRSNVSSSNVSRSNVSRSNVSRSNVTNCLVDSPKNIQTNNMTPSKQGLKDHQPSVSTTANTCESFKVSKEKLRKGKVLHGICPGGAAHYGKLLLTSRTYNKVLESDPNVCSYHRQIRTAERKWIIKTAKKANQKWRIIRPVKDAPKSTGKSGAFDFITSSDEMDITPPEKESDDAGIQLVNKPDPHKAVRRKAVQYSEEEIANLIDGIERMGHFWTQILNAYKFHSSRTATDLADKYKQMKRKSSPTYPNAEEHRFLNV